MRRILVPILVAAISLLTGSAFAHHGTGISYDLAKPPIVLKGTITEYKWANPHVAIFLDVVRDAAGGVK